MTQKASDVIRVLAGKSLATAESCTGGMIGSLLTEVPGASNVYLGGVISYASEVKHRLLGVPQDVLAQRGPVSAPVAEKMADGVRALLGADVAVSVTGLAGPSGDEFGHSVGTVFIGYSDKFRTVSREYHFAGERNAVRAQSADAALDLILQYNE